MPLIKVSNISKTFRVHKKTEGLKGSLKALFKRSYIEKKAVKNVSFNINEGEIIGLLGSNGAGKTTLLKMLTGIIYPTDGEARVLGFTPWNKDNKLLSQISLVMGQKAQLWWDLPAADCFLLLKEIYKIPEVEYRETLNELTQKLNVGHLVNIQIRRLSLGERMKMELIAALLHKPKVLFLDEPTIGLDISSQRVIRDFILNYIDRRKPAVIITSHYMEDIQRLCKRVLIMKSGEIVYDGSLETIMLKYSPNKLIKAQLLENGGQPLLIEGDNKELTKYGEIVSSINNEFNILVKRENVSSTVNYILENFKVKDLSIEETDISRTIESILETRT